MHQRRGIPTSFSFKFSPVGSIFYKFFLTNLRGSNICIEYTHRYDKEIIKYWIHRVVIGSTQTRLHDSRYKCSSRTATESTENVSLFSMAIRPAFKIFSLGVFLVDWLLRVDVYSFHILIFSKKISFTKNVIPGRTNLCSSIVVLVRLYHVTRQVA